jgi:hypothetical protein
MHEPHRELRLQPAATRPTPTWSRVVGQVIGLAVLALLAVIVIGLLAWIAVVVWSNVGAAWR